VMKIYMEVVNDQIAKSYESETWETFYNMGKGNV
jgi:hypothetical protein